VFAPTLLAPQAAVVIAATVELPAPARLETAPAGNAWPLAVMGLLGLVGLLLYAWIQSRPRRRRRPVARTRGRSNPPAEPGVDVHRA
jgi:hypothetical protein